MAMMSSDDTVLSSAPARASSQAVFSSDNNCIERREGTPPSSPPAFPWELEQDKTSTDATLARTDAKGLALSSPLQRPVRNAFSILGKRKPLEATTHNPRPSKQKKSMPKEKDDEGQMQMSLGQTVQKKCTTCGMEYTASSAEDRKLHDKYHKQNTQGYDVGKDFVAKTTQWRKRYGVFKGVQPGDSIVLLDCSDHGHRKKRGQAVLDIVQRELGAVPIPEPQIWDIKMAEYGSNLNAKYKAYLYVRGTKCVGFLLVQNISEAFKVVRPDGVGSRVDATPTIEKGAKEKGSLAALKARKEREAAAEKAIADEIEEAASHPIQLSTNRHHAIMGISRIWTSSTVRGQGIAKRLIETAIRRHNIMAAENAKDRAEHEAGKLRPGFAERDRDVVRDMLGHIEKIEHKEQVAFSQPTDAGAKLARKWYGKAYGWSVYID